MHHLLVSAFLAVDAVTIDTSGASYEFPIEFQFFKDVAATPLFFRSLLFVLRACCYVTASVQQKKRVPKFFAAHGT